MVSMVRFPSFKELNWRSKTSFGYLMIGVLVLILIAVRPEVTLFLISVAYVGASLVWNIWLLVKGEAKLPGMKAAQASGASRNLEHEDEL
jgi:CDP-diacylglycerol--serine O-phosphatidyltransferase